MKSARDIMTTSPVTLFSDSSISDAVNIMLDKGFNGLPVVDHDNGKLVGVICQSDLVAQQKKLEMPSIFSLLGGFITFSGFRDMEKDMKKITALTVGEAMTTSPVTARPDTPVDELADMMVEAKLYTLPIVNEDGKLVGVVGKEDILKITAGRK